MQQVGLRPWLDATSLHGRHGHRRELRPDRLVTVHAHHRFTQRELRELLVGEQVSLDELGGHGIAALVLQNADGAATRHPDFRGGRLADQVPDLLRVIPVDATREHDHAGHHVRRDGLPVCLPVHQLALRVVLNPEVMGDVVGSQRPQGPHHVVDLPDAGQLVHHVRQVYPETAALLRRHAHRRCIQQAFVESEQHLA